MDLLDVSFALTQEQHYLEDCSNAVFANFVNGVKDLVDVFNQLSFLTEKEVQKISQDKIAFYYSREDSKIELKYSEDYMNILIVGSGGEHIINLKNTLPHTEITALDINPHQLKLVKDKVDACNQLTKSNKDTKVNQNNKINKNIQDNVFQAHGGKFEGLFNYLAQKLSSEDIKNIQEDNIFSLKKLQLICQDVFSNKNLNQVFTEEATKYSSENFSDHFYKVFVQKIKELDANPSNMNSILSRTLPMNYPKEMELEGINYYCGDFVSHFNEKITNENHMVLLNAALDNALSIQANEEMEPVLNADKYNMISISNVGDWMPQEQFKSLLDKAKEHLIPNGVVIARKLLGDYSLKDLMLSRFSKVIQEKDNTGFYTECYVGVM
jgi:hypothetical protein